jgi:hypothetical protein
MPSRTAILPIGRPALPLDRRHRVAAGISSITTLASFGPAVQNAPPIGVVSSAIIGDSVVDRLRDTLRLVRLIFDDPAARQVAVVGDFSSWRNDATRMQRDERSALGSDARAARWQTSLCNRSGQHSMGGSTPARSGVQRDTCTLYFTWRARPADARLARDHHNLFEDRWCDSSFSCRRGTRYCALSRRCLDH